MTNDNYVPSPQQIEAAAAQERETWSDREFYVRAGEPLPAWLGGEPYQFPEVRATHDRLRFPEARS